MWHSSSASPNLTLLARLFFTLIRRPYAPHVHRTSVNPSPMDRPAKAKLASLLKKRQRTASSGASSGPATRKKAAATASKHSPSSSSASPPTRARASSISSPDARAKAVELLVQALRVVEAEKKKKGGEAVAGAGDKKKEGKEDASTKPASADIVVAAAGGKKKKAGDGKKAAGEEMAPAAAPATSAPSAATGPFTETRVREAATAIEEALHDQWKVGDHHEYNNKLRHLVFNLHRNDALRKQVLDGTLPPTKLLSLPIEALRTDAEKDAAKAVETKEVLGYSHSHVFSDVIFEEAVKGATGTGGGGTGGKCQKCQSTKVLFSRRQSYNESSTWCGEEQGAPLMMNCLSCGTVESIRE